MGAPDLSYAAAYFKAYGQSGGSPPFNTLYAQTPGMANMFGVVVNANHGEVCLGCLDAGHYYGDFVWKTNTGDQDYTFEMDMMAVNNVVVEISRNQPVVIDTGK